MATANKKQKQFSVSKVIEPVTFKVDEDEFEAIPANRLPAGILGKYFEQINNSQLFAAHEDFFKAVLTEESFKVFEDRLNSKESPIPITTLGDIASWLLGEVYMSGEATEESKPS